MNVPHRDRDAAPPTIPTACPFCRATTLSSPTEKLDPHAYWRCEACGEMWNSARLQTTQSRYGHDPRWR